MIVFVAILGLMALQKKRKKWINPFFCKEKQKCYIDK
ncbi:hypothetical protein CC1_04040 [Coprococcus catus GD/7]|uniref:Uncharacterized protein n=1 Tax=Coprococcus catus GD/7 TaxID=717962 RepID=D4J4R6_9FIRM|nr:hypothetical protein CC1_04040 [Coprococcus catus GD/7]